MITKKYKIKQILLAATGLTACLILAVILFPSSASAASKGTFALSCTQGKVEVKKNVVSCSKGPDIVTVQGIGTKAQSKTDGTPYPTTTDLTVVSADCGVSSPKKLQLGQIIEKFECEKKSITPTVKITSTIKKTTSGTKVPVYSVSRESGQTTGGRLSAKSAADCKPTDGSCYDCQADSKTGKAPAGCPGCENGVCVDQAASPNAKCSKAHGCDIIGKYVNPLINLLSVCFGLIAVASIIFGGIQYSMSAGDPQEVSKAKDRIKKTLFAIVAYFFLYALLQFLVPGGVFNRPT